jgi:hypothetical protein
VSPAILTALGDVSLATVGPVTDATLSDVNDQQMKPAIPILYAAELVNVQANSML